MFIDFVMVGRESCWNGKWGRVFKILRTTGLSGR